MCHHCAVGFFIFLNVLGLLISFALTTIGILVLLSKGVVNRFTLPYIEKWSEGLIANNESQTVEMANQFHNLLAPMGYPPLIFGCFIFVITIVAILGAAMKKPALLILYTVLSALLIVGPIAFMIVYFANRQPFYTATHTFIENGMKGYTNLQSTKARTLLMGAMMSGYKCCGYNNATDFTNWGWAKEDYLNGELQQVDYPIPCCKPPDGGWPKIAALSQTEAPGTCPPAFTETNSYITLGCKDSFDQTIIALGDTLVLLAIGPLFFSVITFGLAVFIIHEQMHG